MISENVIALCGRLHHLTNLQTNADGWSKVAQHEHMIKSQIMSRGIVLSYLFMQRLNVKSSFQHGCSYAKDIKDKSTCGTAARQCTVNQKNCGRGDL